MKEERYFYLIKVQFLGFRYSGWQKQPGQKTIESMLTKTLKFILEGRKFRILGAGRTDAKVSALDAAFELFLYGQPIENFIEFKNLFNKNLPPDIRVIEILKVDTSFNIIKNGKLKEYVYLFSFGKKNHPFCAPFIANIIESLDIELMMKAAKLFEGTHDFRNYTARIQENTKVIRTIHTSKILYNDLLKANFFPESSYAFKVRSKGFMRYQIRMMMGTLIQLGRGELDYSDFQKSLDGSHDIKFSYIAPGSGLLLHQLNFE